MGIFKELISAFTEGYRKEQAKNAQQQPGHPSPGVCHICHIRISEGSAYCLFCGSENWPGAGNCYKHVRVERAGSNFRITCATSDSAAVKMAQKELRLIAQAVSNLKRSIMEKKRQVRADFTHSIRKPQFFDGGAGLKRMNLADHLGPIEEKQRVLESLRIAVREAIIEVERIGLSLD